MPEQMQEVLFEEEQSFRQGWVWALVSGMLVVLVVPLVLVVSGVPVKEGSSILAGVMGLLIGIGVLIGTAALIYTMKLTVRLDDTGMHVRFWPFVNRDIRLDDIARWEARTYRPLLEYGGWGIRCGWSGMAYNVSGNQGVQLEFSNGKRLLLGSKRPDELAAAITLAKQR